MKDWNDFRLFLAVARSGTLTSAAAELGLGVSTLHRHLNELEAALGSALFERGPRGYQLTQTGEALLPRAEDVEEAILAASRTVVGHDNEASGEVRVTTPQVLLSEIAPHLVALTGAHPRIRPVLLPSDAALDLKRETDVALRATTQPLDTAIGQKVCGLAWARYASVATSGDELPWIHYLNMDESPAVQWRKKAYPTSRPVILVEGVMGMHAVLGGARAQGLLPCFVGDRDPALRRLGQPVAMNQLWVLVHADLRRSARVRALIDFIIPRIQADRARLEGDEPARR